MRVRPLTYQPKCFKTQVSRQVAVRCYIVSTEGGRLYGRRNRSHLNKVPENFQGMLDEDKALSKVDTQIRPRARRSTEEIPQLRTESSAMQMPAASQPGFQPALPSVPVPDSTRSDGVVKSSEFMQPDPHPAPPSVPILVSTRSGSIVRRPAYLRDFTT